MYQFSENNYRWSRNHAQEKDKCCVEYGFTHPQHTIQIVILKIVFILVIGTQENCCSYRKYGYLKLITQEGLVQKANLRKKILEPLKIRSQDLDRHDIKSKK